MRGGGNFFPTRVPEEDFLVIIRLNNYGICNICLLHTSDDADEKNCEELVGAGEQ